MLHKCLFLLPLLCFFTFVASDQANFQQTEVRSADPSIPPIAIKPHSYVVETTIPKNNVLLVNQTQIIQIWPKNALGENITVHGSQISVVAKPIEFTKVYTKA